MITPSDFSYKSDASANNQSISSAKEDTLSKYVEAAVQDQQLFAQQTKKQTRLIDVFKNEKIEKPQTEAIRQAQKIAAAVAAKAHTQFNQLQERTRELEKMQYLTAQKYAEFKREIATLENLYNTSYKSLYDNQKKLPELLNDIDQGEQKFFLKKNHNIRLRDIHNTIEAKEAETLGKTNILESNNSTKLEAILKPITAPIEKSFFGFQFIKDFLQARQTLKNKNKFIKALDRLAPPTIRQIVTYTSSKEELKSKIDTLQRIKAHVEQMKANETFDEKEKIFLKNKLQELTSTLEHLEREYSHRQIFEQLSDDTATSNDKFNLLLDLVISEEVSGHGLSISHKSRVYDQLEEQIESYHSLAEQIHRNLGLVDKINNASTDEELKTHYNTYLTQLLPLRQYPALEIDEVPPHVSKHFNLKNLQRAIETSERDLETLSQAFTQKREDLRKIEEMRYDPLITELNRDEIQFDLLSKEFSINKRTPRKSGKEIFKNLAEQMRVINNTLQTSEKAASPKDKDFLLKQAVLRLEYYKKCLQIIDANSEMKTRLTRIKTTHKPQYAYDVPLKLEAINALLQEVKDKISPDEQRFHIESLPPLESTFSYPQPNNLKNLSLEETIQRLLNKTNPPSPEEKKQLMEHARMLTETMRISIQSTFEQILEAVKPLERMRSDDETYAAASRELIKYLEIYQSYYEHLAETLTKYPLLLAEVQDKNPLSLNQNNLEIEKISQRIAQVRTRISGKMGEITENFGLLEIRNKALSPEASLGHITNALLIGSDIFTTSQVNQMVEKAELKAQVLRGLFSKIGALIANTSSLEELQALEEEIQKKFVLAEFEFRSIWPQAVEELANMQSEKIELPKALTSLAEIFNSLDGKIKNIQERQQMKQNIATAIANRRQQLAV